MSRALTNDPFSARPLAHIQVPEDLYFNSETERARFFKANPMMLVEGVVCSVLLIPYTYTNGKWEIVRG